MASNIQIRPQLRLARPDERAPKVPKPENLRPARRARTTAERPFTYVSGLPRRAERQAGAPAWDVAKLILAAVSVLVGFSIMFVGIAGYGDFDACKLAGEGAKACGTDLAYAAVRVAAGGALLFSGIYYWVFRK